MNSPSPTHGPASLLSLEGTPLGHIDLLGRHKILAHRLTDRSPESMIRKTAASAFAEIEVNHFKFKSLSCWSYNTAVGCLHGCRFCYVPASQHTQPGKGKENTGPLASALREFGILDPDADWGHYALFALGMKKSFWFRWRGLRTPLERS
jgi:hypothetical protein